MHSTPNPNSDIATCCFGERKIGILPVPMINKSNGSFELDQSYFKQHIYRTLNFYTDEFVKIIGKPREKNQNFTKRN